MGRVTVPRDLEQANRALTKAQDTRSYRAELKRQLRIGRVDRFELVAGHVAEWDPWIRGMLLWKLVEMLPGVGLETALECIETYGFPLTLKVADAPYALRQAVADGLRAAIEGEEG